MGGKSYYCDYCLCFLKNDINVRKIHNSGLTHKIAKIRYMRSFTDPRKVLEEECSKESCYRYLSGRYCKFDLLCNSTHFNKIQLQRLREIADRLERTRRQKPDPKAVNEIKKKIILPWQSNDGKKRRQETKRFTESLKPISFNRMNSDSLNLEWG
ncbi:uncharacterized protein LOC129247922 [Anastrepha obliqua]|uniref:uncharacterized protein LOC129247922 n=1 Tax=Anastrepha obliqua TaxID=95512 RepID=UPI002409093B|nr:uncharacterized protein LOC129247922 [Anastrepha obliqua]